MINRISTDGRGRYLLTCSGDKTAKLWDITSGELLRTFRPPIGDGNEGKLFAGALSPDGRSVAVGGWTSKDGLSNNIYIFDANSGLLLQRIIRLPNVILDLEYSPDGKYLAAALGGSNGFRIYRSNGYALQAQDDDYGGDSYNLAFDAWGRLATVSYDGYLRLYDNQFKLIKKIATKAGKEPFSLAFSPDASLLVVGYEDSPIIQVFDATTLEFRFTPKSSAEIEPGGLDILAFSSDGSQLAAGGFYKFKKGETWWRQIRIWNQSGKGSYTDYDGGTNSIVDIKPLPGGGFVFGGTQPDWGIIDPATGRRSRYQCAETFSYNAIDNSHFRLSTGGTEVGLTPLGLSPVRFSLTGRHLSRTASSQPSYTAERNALVVTDWQNHFDPKLNGKALTFLQKYERCRSVDVATGGQGIIFGTERNVCCTDAKGQLRWSQSTQDVAWCVKVDEYNQVVAAALGDGTIRWYRFRDGQPLLSLYLHPEGERWVLWTPSGYYDCSPGAESLIGWHVNNGPDKAANYYPIARLRETYYRPDVVDLILETLDEAAALQDANAKNNRRSTTRSVSDELPPIVRILSPASETETGQTTVTIAYTIESPKGENVTGLRIAVDGRPVATPRGLKPINQRLEAQVTIPAGDCTVSVIAENRFGASEAASVRLRWKGTVKQESAGVDVRPSLYVLAVGVSDYAHASIEDLSYAGKDAADFEALIKKQEGLLYKSVKTKLLVGPNASKDNILDGLDWLQRQTTSRDVAMLFFAGHGVDDNSGNFYYLPHNADPEALRRTCLIKAEVQTTVASVAGKIIVFMDACHSGNLMKEIRRSALPPDVVGVINELVSAENGAVVFSSATSRQYALEDAKWQNGAFTEALLEGLSGKGKAPGSDKITIKTLDAYVSERVKALTNGQQAPTTLYPVNVPDFPIGIVK